MPKKIVLAYSGGLDTSVILKWLQNTYNCPVVTFTADLGQGEELASVKEKAESLGVKEIYIENLKEEFVKNYVFPKVSDLLGPVQLTVTVIETANKAHNVVPPDCKLVVDVRVNECYTCGQILEELNVQINNAAVTLTPRSMRIKSSAIALEHPLVKAGMAIGSKPYGSPTTSDKALVSFPALKMGPGESARSHSADEFVLVAEIENGIQKYIELLDQVLRNQ